MKVPAFPLPRRVAVCLLAVCLPVALEAASLPLPGVPNFQRVNDLVYRGGQPLDAGFTSLAKLGIRTIVDLREIGEHSQAQEQELAETAGMRYVSVPMKGMSKPTDEQVLKVLALLNDPAAGPVFVHCHRGSDRTGAVIACYRIGHDHWDTGKALKEARSYGMSWYQLGLKNYVQHYQPQSAAPVVAADAAPGAVR